RADTFATAIPAELNALAQRTCAERTMSASDLSVGVDRLANAAHGFVDRDAVVLASVTEAEAHGSRVAVLGAGDQLEGHLGEGVRADLLLHPLVGYIQFGPHTVGAQPVDDVAEVVGELFGDGHTYHLHGREPRRERAGVVLEQDGEEALDRTEQRPVDHD